MSVPAQPAKTTDNSIHSRLTSEQAESFGKWLDEQLAQLERDFAEYMTPQSIKASQRSTLQAGRHTTE